MLKTPLPLVLPYRICRSNQFALFINDLTHIGINHFIITVDFDIQTESINFHRLKLRSIRKHLQELTFNDGNSVKFKVVTNHILRDTYYTDFDILRFKVRPNELFFLTLPLFGRSDWAMKNIFTIKNLGYIPIINSFEKISVTYPKKFCELLTGTENLGFVYDCDFLSNPKNIAYLHNAISSFDYVLFSSFHNFTNLIDKNLNSFINILRQKYKIPLAESSKKLIKRYFKRNST